MGKLVSFVVTAFVVVVVVSYLTAHPSVAPGAVGFVKQGGLFAITLAQSVLVWVASVIRGL